MTMKNRGQHDEIELVLGYGLKSINKNTNFNFLEVHI